jgi:hypothetical protein
MLVSFDADVQARILKQIEGMRDILSAELSKRKMDKSTAVNVEAARDLAVELIARSTSIKPIFTVIDGGKQDS